MAGVVEAQRLLRIDGRGMGKSRESQCERREQNSRLGRLWVATHLDWQVPVPTSRTFTPTAGTVHIYFGPGYEMKNFTFRDKPRDCQRTLVHNLGAGRKRLLLLLDCLDTTSSTLAWLFRTLCVDRKRAPVLTLEAPDRSLRKSSQKKRSKNSQLQIAHRPVLGQFFQFPEQAPGCRIVCATMSTPPCLSTPSHILTPAS